MQNFEFKPFEEMTAEDYRTIGFKSGLEVHQQLLTEKKLFCRCPAGKYSEDFHAEILRHMRPTLSERGEYDGTDLIEFKTKKEIIYRINRATVCTYEMDDTPPFLMNDQALDIAIEIGLLMDSNIVDELHIARKQYLDGSIPTGFQRTAIVCTNGKIPYKDREINIIQMSIEEDSCREISDFGHRRVYNTDRLGMPLIETVTAPEMHTPDEVADVNQIIRKLTRSTGHVRTGVGAGREDVNVSVTGGTRIEIKGVSSIKAIPLLTYNEAMRQWNLLKLRDELHNRGITEDTFEAKTDDVTKILRKTYYEPVSNAIAQGKIVKCITLRGFKGLLSWKTQTDTFFAKEISDRVRVIACISQLPNIVHSDSAENTLSTNEGQKIRKFVGADDEKDTLVLVWGDPADAETAAKEIIIRAKEATIGIPSETRQALRDGTNGFERILPGPDRMYPDTDLPPIQITDERIHNLRINLPEKYWMRENRYKEIGLTDDLIQPLSISKFAKLFDYASENLKIDPKLVANVLIQFIKRLQKNNYDVSLLTVDNLKPLFEAFKDGKMVKDSFYYVMRNIIENNGEITDNTIPSPATEQDIKVAFKHGLEQIYKISFYHSDKRKDVLIGLILTELRGRVNGKDILDFVNENYSEVR
jgi:glutamyl-tRNA(Gln) amidotransferase subunit E